MSECNYFSSIRLYIHIREREKENMTSLLKKDNAGQLLPNYLFLTVKRAFQ
uniref:Uncharacterized protein n=1 Tax=Meloidogyne enterolobii TaxID=390850 RepID=A0A6V7U228_MELEN|nr:unnamed protein product [Meloidogyne enterolobii]